MGYIRHDAIIVTSWQEESARVAHSRARILGCTVTAIVVSLNGYLSFMIAPDGSKEGWSESDLGDERRAKMITWLKAQGNHNRRWLDWVEVSYGGDDPSLAQLKDHNLRVEEDE